MYDSDSEFERKAKIRRKSNVLDTEHVQIVTFANYEMGNLSLKV